MKRLPGKWTGNNGHDPGPRSGFTQVVSFAEAFPGIAKAVIRGEEVGGDPSPKPHRVRFTERTLPGEHIPCRNPGCQKGGFKIGMVLRTMIEHGSDCSNTSALCKGYEPCLDQDKKMIYKKCMQILQLDIKVRYKPRPKNR